MQEQIVRQHPRISANKLGEYLVSPPLRRMTIIERQKYPSTFIGAYYEPARATILDFMLGRTDRVGMLERMETLVSSKHESSWSKHRANGCAEAVLRFLDLEPRLDFRGMKPVQMEEYDRLDVCGVDVSVYPDLVLEGIDARGKPLLGALKLHFPKSHPHTEAAGEYVATLLRMHAMLALGKEGRVREDACFVVDVFSGNVMSAPRGYKRRWRDISAACAEIRQAWPDA